MIIYFSSFYHSRSFLGEKCSTPTSNNGAFYPRTFSSMETSIFKLIKKIKNYYKKFKHRKIESRVKGIPRYPSSTSKVFNSS